jgi:hypothetical protein
LYIKGSEKGAFAVMVAIMAPAQNCLYFSAAGKTHAIDDFHYGGASYHCTDHSEAGWTTTGVFCRWLAWYRDFYNDGEPRWLILNGDTVRCQKEINHLAAELGINFYSSIPA